MNLSTSWLTCLTCSSSVIQSYESPSTPFTIAIQWLKFIFLYPCPQRVLFSSVDLLFLFTLVVLSTRKFFSRFRSNENSYAEINRPLLGNRQSHLQINIWLKLSLIATTILAIAYVVLSVFTFTQSTQSAWKIAELMFHLVQAITQVVILKVIACERKSEAFTHPMSLRIYWVLSFATICLLSATAISRLIYVNEGGMDPGLRMDDIFFLVSLPISAFLFIVAVRGFSGLSVIRESESGVNSENQLNGLVSKDANISEYASASLFSRAVWLWVNPLVNKGYKTPLKADEIPSLPHDDQAERMSELFELNWPENSKHPVRITLLVCFWKDIAFTGFLAIVRLAVMNVGPVLIQSFVDLTSGKRTSRYEGYYLVLALLIAKTTEVLSSHHFNFQCRKLGMLMRSSLITTLYKKGLRLSSSSRQTHGVGQIVNYMAADAQQLSDIMLQLHSIWLMPLQVAAALALIYIYLSASAFAALIGVIIVLVFTLVFTRKNNVFQYHVMRNRDSRMKAINEMLNNMRVIKFQAWEEHFGNRIQFFREQEYNWIGKFLYSSSCTMAVLFSSPIAIAALTFALAASLGLTLDAGTVFTATTVFKILQEPIRGFPQSLIQISQAMISLERLESFMKSREVEENSNEREEGYSGSIAVEVKDGNFSWDDEGVEEVLKNLNLEIKKGELATVVGTVGSGKSSFLASILGEMHKISGKVRVCGTTAYVAQTSWIRNGTVQENILFGLPMNRMKYEEVIRICCLDKDLEIMEDGDQTEIGERGINLSGGQKQRIQLARAVYQDSDIYLLDDIFSAVDAQTGSQLFKECVRGALKDKTIILVTHQVDFLHNADHILVMQDGMIVESGKYEKLLESGLHFRALVAAYETSMELAGMKNAISGEVAQETPKSPGKCFSQTESTVTNGSAGRSEADKGSSKLIEDEEKETGHVSWDLYRQYCTRAYGWWGVAGVILTSLLWQVALMASDYWLAYETSEDRKFIPSTFIIVYLVISVVSFILVTIRAFLLTFLGLKTAQSFFKQLLSSILHAPMSFFDTTPSGRILSRASNDQVNIDILIPLFLGMTTLMSFALISVVFITCLYSWPTIFLVVPLIWMNVWYKGYYLASSREITRLDSITKAPVIHHFSETISGVMTIRSFKKQSRFCKENIDLINASLRMDFYNNALNEWLGFRLEIIGCLVLCVATLLMVILPSSIIKPEYVGLSLSYGLALNVVLFGTIYMSCFLENRMVSVERIKQFTNIPSEAPWKATNRLPSPNWPSHGNIELKNLLVRYRSNTPLILKGINLSIKGGDKIGVVGRTGSGKSTLIQVFFRLVEPCGGYIIIDGVDICTLGLHDLRSRLGIIPQEPILFQGTVRSNIDPLGLYSEDEIWKSLERCQLKDVVTEKPEKLEAPVVDEGENWSVGQRQLLCLGRVMLKRSQILFMDEATASVDSQNDAVIQKVIREDFAACTIISIAHRIPTVMDSDRVLVMDNGLAKEFDKPSKLLERPSLFGALVQEYANRSSEY